MVQDTSNKTHISTKNNKNSKKKIDLTQLGI